MEFNIVPTCLDLDWKKWEIIYKDVLNKNDLESYRKSLKNITKRCLITPIHMKTQPSIKKLLNISGMEKDKNLYLEKAIGYLDKIRLGLTLDFARAARRGFIVASLFKSAKNTGILDRKSEIGFYKTVKTVSMSIYLT